jgi:hypothetical protein
VTVRVRVVCSTHGLFDVCQGRDAGPLHAEDGDGAAGGIKSHQQFPWSLEGVRAAIRVEEGPEDHGLAALEDVVDLATPGGSGAAQGHRPQPVSAVHRHRG